MNVSEYTDLVEKRLERNFDIERNINFLNLDIPLFAKMEMFNEKYFASKQVKVWRAENYEYIFLKDFSTINEKTIEDFQKFLINALEELVDPHNEHMSSVITGVMVTSNFPEDLENKIKKFKHKKIYAFSFKGWAEVRLMVVSLHSNRVISNRKGKEVQDFYLPTGIKRKKGIINFFSK
ncbi:hypothetical protein BHF71_08220 [Vulcanibacillus modesticaldus]|uniref:DUF8052 domain-containing protein n=1 Tax=Vulcanibacillus modesticaldus TaxID=337097 RepID=A0A1D2YV63_9BACI|nr:hypothetical protein [Vulcanibacillus modesticaldus]OEF99598.1 hypothetical protein BHF71_08220 [Vulcanibacillus modesticaldus]